MEYPAVMSLRQSQLAGQTLTARRRAKQSVNPGAKKHSPLPNFGYIVSSVHPSPPQGAFRDRHETRAGVRWPRRRRRAKSRLWGGNPSMVLREQRQARYDTALTASRFGFDGERTPAVEDCERGCARTEKSCGPDARGLCVKSCGDVAAQPGTRISHLHGDGGNSASLPGESTKDTVKTIRAGKAGMSCAFDPHTGLRVPAGARPSLRPAFERRARRVSKTRAKAAARMRARVRNWSVS